MSDAWRDTVLECCATCGCPKVRKGAPGDEVYLGWPACQNEECPAYREGQASASFKRISDLHPGPWTVEGEFRLPTRCTSVKDANDVILAFVPMDCLWLANIIAALLAEAAPAGGGEERSDE